MPAERARGAFRAGALCLALLAAPAGAFGQADGGGHLGHHPGGDAAAAPIAGPAAAASSAGPAAAAPGAGPAAGGGCGGMMGCMGGGGAKPFYPALMDMPALTPEARQFIEAEAGRRLGAGSAAIASGQSPLHHALSVGNAASMQQAASGIREGVLLVESGASALRALSEGQPPREIALGWFKGQMSVPSGSAMPLGGGPWGLSWYHLTLMAFLAALLAGAAMLHVARARRIDGLITRLAPGAAPAPAAKAAPAAAPGAARSTAPAPAQGAPKQQWSGALRVAAIFRETPTVKTFRLTHPECGPFPFTFLPGQFLTFSAEIDGKPVKRSYTIASAPTQRDYVEITVKREDQGAESRYLHDHVAVGDRLQVSGPSGVFTFTGAEADSIVLIGGGVGITPMMCVIRHLTDRAFPGDIFFLYGARAPEDFIFREELEYLQRRHGNLHVTAVMAKAEGTAWAGPVGNISQEFIAAAVPDIARRRVHVCGPPPMMEAVKAHLAALGVPKDKVKTEAFGPARGAAPAPDAALPPDAKPPTDVGAPSGASSAQVEVKFSKSGKSGPLAPDQSVLEAAEAIGVAIDFSCRVGTCGTCVVPLLEGAVTMEVEDGLAPEDKARGIILACQAKSSGPLVVDA